MCGIYGIVFHESPRALTKEQRGYARGVFTGLAMSAVTRGYDAAGMVRVEKSGRHGMYKNNVASTEIVEYSRWNRQLNKLGRNTVGILGHTRFGTHGANTIPNAHPFMFPTVKRGQALVGTHNGVVYNYSSYGRTDLEVDSANLFYGLSVRPPEEWADLLGVVQGSFALVWSYGSDIYFARNSGSPCVLGYSDKLKATIYASTQTIIAEAVRSVPGLDDVKITGDLITYKIHKFTPFNALGGDAIQIGDFDDGDMYGHHGMWQGGAWGGDNYSARPLLQAAPKDTSSNHSVMSLKDAGKEWLTGAKEVLSPSDEYICGICSSDYTVRYSEYAEIWICEQCAEQMQVPPEPAADTVEPLDFAYREHTGRPGFHYMTNKIDCGLCKQQYTLEALDDLILWDSEDRVYTCRDCIDKTKAQMQRMKMV